MTELILEETIKHSGRIIEHNIRQPKLKYYNSKGIFNCTECDKLIKLYDRVVSKRKSSSYKVRGNTDLYCKKCAIDLIIIVEKD